MVEGLVVEFRVVSNICWVSLLCDRVYWNEVIIKLFIRF